MVKKGVAFLSMLLFLAAAGLGAGHASSPTQAHSEIDVSAAHTGTSENGDALMKVFFTYNLDKNSVWSSSHAVTVTWSEGWRAVGYSLLEDGKYRLTEVEIRQTEADGQLSLSLDPARHFDRNGNGLGYVLLASDDEKLLSRAVNSTVAVQFHYNSLVKDFKLAESIGWNNEAALDYH